MDPLSAIFKLTLTPPSEEGGKHVVEMVQVLKTKPFEAASRLHKEFNDEDEASAAYNDIFNQPFPGVPSSRQSLNDAQDKVLLPGKTDAKGNPKDYKVPDILKTYTRRGYAVILSGAWGDEDKKKLVSCTANLVLVGEENKVVNSATAKAPWAALDLLSVLTERWFVFIKTGEIKRPKIKRSEIPEGAVMPEKGPEIEENLPPEKDNNTPDKAKVTEPEEVSAGQPKKKSGKPKGE